MKLIITILFVLMSFFSKSQSENVIVKDNYKFIFNFDMRNSFMIGHSVKFNGMKFGIGNSKQRFGIGFYGLRKPVITSDKKVNVLDATSMNKFEFGYISFFYERVLFQNKRWEVSTPVHINLGSVKGKYLSTNGYYTTFLDRPTASITMSFKGHFKIFRWIGATAGGGYNLMITNDKRERKALNAPFYSFGVKLFLEETIKLIFNKNYRKSPWID